MTSFCLNASVIGTKKHLIYNDETFYWSTEIPFNIWHLDGTIKKNNDWCLDTLLKLSNVKIDLNPPERFVRSFETVCQNYEGNVPWQLLMPKKEHQDFIKKIIENIRGIISELQIEYFKKTWLLGNKIIYSLNSAKIDKKNYQSIVDSKPHNLRVIESFIPDNLGYSKTTNYNRFGTLTGRLTVENGPNILTLKKEYRSLLEPRSKDNCLISIDFSALEARVLLYEAGRRCDDLDLYASIAKEFGYDRKSIKAAVISELYGSSKKTLSTLLGMHDKELETFIDKIQSYFNTRALLQKIKQQFIKNGYITNRYGRKILIDEPLDYVLVNYYAQSTGADVSLTGFSLLYENLKKHNFDITPIFLLHDALILDVPKIILEEIKSLSKSINVPGYVQSFPLKMEIMS